MVLSHYILLKIEQSCFFQNAHHNKHFHYYWNTPLQYKAFVCV